MNQNDIKKLEARVKVEQSIEKITEVLNCPRLIHSVLMNWLANNTDKCANIAREMEKIWSK